MTSVQRVQTGLSVRNGHWRSAKLTAELTSDAPAARTDQAFTVATWVRADANSNGYRTVVAAYGGWHSTFYLRRDSGNIRNFAWVANDSDPAGGGSAAPRPPPRHRPRRGCRRRAKKLRRAEKQARLYVNGQVEAGTAVAGIFAAAGLLMIDHDRWVGKPNFHDPWHGAIDDVRVFAGALPGDEITKLFQL